MSSGPARPLRRWQAHYGLGMLLVLFVSSHVDRNILNILIDPIRNELDVSDTWMGLLAGPAFALFYAILGVPVARWADRASRKAIILAGLVIWSLMTAAQGLVRLFWQLLAARVLVGVGEATISPASHSMVSDYYPPERRAKALAIYTSGGHIGMMVGYMLGGFIQEAFGWRMAFVVVGLPGLALAVLFGLTVREPARGESEARHDETKHGLGETLLYLWARPTFRHLNYSAVLYVVVIFAFNVWGPAFLMRVHDMPIAEAGLFFGPVTGIAGFAGTLASGALADRLSLRDVRWQMWIPMLGGLGMLPFAVGFLFAPEPRVGLAFYALQVFLSTFWMGPSFWVCQGLARLRMRAMAAAILLLNINIFGTGLGPLALGILNDLFRGPYGELGIRYSLLTVCVLMFWAVFHSYRVSRTLAVDLAASHD